MTSLPFEIQTRPVWQRVITALKPASVTQTLSTGVLFVGAWLMIFPFVWMISASLKRTDEVYDSDFHFWPREFAGGENYYGVLFDQPYLTFLANSFIVCIGILLVQIVTAVPVAYALAKLRFRGSAILFGTVVASLTIPINVTSIPLYLGLVKFQLLDSYFALMFPFFISVFAIFLFRQFFAGFPDSVIEAARVDGFTELEIILRLVLPASVPAIAAFSVFSFVAHWNDLYWPLIVVQSQDKMTAALSMLQYQSDFDTDYGRTFASATVVTLPMVVVFLFARRLFINSITMTGVKG